MKTSRRRVDAVRRFSRFYTRLIGLLDEGLLESPFSLTEARVIYELALGDRPTPTEVAARLGIDAGYLSRILRRLDRRGLVDRARSETDRRSVLLDLSSNGRQVFEELDAASTTQITRLLSAHDGADQERIVESMALIERILGDVAPPPSAEVRPSFTLRPHRPGDMGWIVQRHGELYTESHGWDATFEAMVARIASDFLQTYDPRWERSWIAEVDGERAGAVVLVRRSKTVGQLRLLFVDPSARGLGIGARLVSECVGQARHVGYRTMTLFTVRGLDSARRLYEAEGFRLVHEEAGHDWGADHVAQRWDLKL